MVTRLQIYANMKERRYIMARTIRQLHDREMADMAILYADPRSSFGHRDAEERYDITESTFRTALEHAAIEHKVSDQVFQRMEEKALYNVREKIGQEAEHRVRLHYAELRRRREAFTVPEKKALWLVIKYSESPCDKAQFCREIALDTKFFDRVVMSVILTDKIADETFEMLRKKGLKNNWSRNTMDFWDKISKERKSRLGRDE